MSICDVPVIADVCDSMGEGPASLVAAPFDWLGQAMAQAAAWLFEAVWSVFDTTTLVDLTSPQYLRVYNVLFGIAVFVYLAFFCLQLITGLVHRDPGALSRAALGLAKSVLGSFLVVSLTALLLEITDQLAVGIVQATGNTMKGLGDQVLLLAAGLSTISLAAPGAGAVVTIFLSGLAISAAAIVWFSLLIRKALLLVAVVFGPIALAGATWDATKGWFSKWVSFVVALVLSKLVLVVVFLVAIGQVSAPIDADLTSVSDPIAGVVLMFVAAFAPYLAYKFVSFIGFDMYHAMSAEQEAKSALNRPIPIPVTPPARTCQAVLGGGTSSGSGAAPARPQPAGGATSVSGAAGGGSGLAASGGTAGSGAAAAGPVGAGVVAGAAVVGAAAAAGPRAGAALGGAANAQAGAAAEQTSPPPPAAQQAPGGRPVATVLSAAPVAPAPRTTPSPAAGSPGRG